MYECIYIYIFIHVRQKDERVNLIKSQFPHVFAGLKFCGPSRLWSTSSSPLPSWMPFASSWYRAWCATASIRTSRVTWDMELKGSSNWDLDSRPYQMLIKHYGGNYDHVHVCIYIYTYTHPCLCIYIYIQLYIYIHIRIHNG